MTDPASPEAEPGPGAPARPGPFRWPVEVRFRDLDPMGHAHHSLPLIYFEEARAAFWREVTGREGLDGIDYVLAEALVRFRRRIRFPQRAQVELRLTRLGRSAFDLEYRLVDAGGEPLAEGRTVQVMYDYELGASKPLPVGLRRRLAERLTPPAPSEAGQSSAFTPTSTSPTIPPSR